MATGKTFTKFATTKTLTAVGMSAAMIGVLTACGSSSTSSVSSSEGTSTTAASAGADSCDNTINLFTWSSYHDDPWLAEYETQTGVKINSQLIGSVPEAFAKVKADPGAFDLVLATSGWVENYAESDLIVPVDESKIPNLSNVLSTLDWRAATTYVDKNYGVPYAWGSQPLIWADDRVTPAPTDWSALFDPKYKGRVSLVDDPTTQLPVIAIAAGIKDPYNMTDAEFETFKAKLNELRPQVTHVSASIQDQTTDFTGGQVDLGILYNISTWVESNKAGTKVSQIIPAEGTPGWTDNYVVTKAGDEKNKCNNIVNDFINATLSKEWQGRFIGTSGNNGALSVEAAKSPEAVAAGLTTDAYARTELAQSELDPQFFEKVRLLRRLPNLQAWLDAWNEFKLGIG